MVEHVSFCILVGMLTIGIKLFSRDISKKSLTSFLDIFIPSILMSPNMMQHFFSLLTFSKESLSRFLNVFRPAMVLFGCL